MLVHGQAEGISGMTGSAVQHGKGRDVYCAKVIAKVKQTTCDL